MIEIYQKIKNDVVGREIETKSILVAMEAGKHILLEGPPGTSKSTLLRKIARKSRIPLYIIEGNIDLTPAKLVGHFNPAKVMSDSYQPEYFEKGPLTKAMEEGGILYIEEFNRMPADVSNVLISPMEEGEMYIPRYGTVKAVRPFTLIAAQNPYDDVGTVRISRAFMDRICMIKLDYQSEEEEREIVRIRTGLDLPEVIACAVRMVRETRRHQDIKLGASVRAAIDTVDLYAGLQKLDEQPENNFLLAAQMALSNKIWLNETTGKTADEIIREIWDVLKDQCTSLAGVSKSMDSASSGKTNPDEEEEGGLDQKKNDFSLKNHPLDPFSGMPLLDFETNDPRHYWRLADYLNNHPDELEFFFEQPGSLEAFARMVGRMTDEVATRSIRIASRLIIKVARQIADTGYRSGKLHLVKGCADGAEIELDRSLEKYADEPQKGIAENLMSYERHREKKAFVMMLDYSYSMQSKIILAATIAAAVAQHFKRDYALIVFNTGVSVLKKLEENIGPERVLEKLFSLHSYGETNIRMALEAGVKAVGKFERKSGLILTDGDWNKGGDPLPMAARFDKLSVIAFPPAQYEKISQLAVQGHGAFSLVQNETEIAGAIAKSLS